MSINCVQISGNLTRDAEVRATSGGTDVVSFGIAVNDRRKNAGTGEWEDYANFIDCVAFGSRFSHLAQGGRLNKGAKCFIEGKLRYSSWEKDGVRKSKVEVVVEDIDFAAAPKQDSYEQPVLLDEDIPF